MARRERAPLIHKIAAKISHMERAGRPLERAAAVKVDGGRIERAAFEKQLCGRKEDDILGDAHGSARLNAHCAVAAVGPRDRIASDRESPAQIPSRAWAEDVDRTVAVFELSDIAVRILD